VVKVVKGTCNAARRTRVVDAGDDITVAGARNLVEGSRVVRRYRKALGGHGLGVTGCGSINVFRDNNAKGLAGASFPSESASSGPTITERPVCDPL